MPFHFLGGLCETSSYCYLSHTGNHTSQKVISIRQKEGIFFSRKMHTNALSKLPKKRMEITEGFNEDKSGL